MEADKNSLIYALEVVKSTIKYDLQELRSGKPCNIKANEDNLKLRNEP